MAKSTLVRTYKSDRDFQRDANRLFKKGYVVASTSAVPGHVLFGHTLLKWVTGVGILMGPTRSHTKISVVYNRTTRQPNQTAPSFAT